MSFKPDGYTTVSPYLIVADAEATLRFTEAVFGANRLRITPREDGRTRHAEVRIGDSVVMMGEIPGGSTAHVHVYVADIAATMDRAVAAGGKIIHPIAEQNGDLRGGVADGNGTVWWLTTPIGATA